MPAAAKQKKYSPINLIIVKDTRTLYPLRLVLIPERSRAV